MNSSENAPANRWPPQVRYIVGNEACERFSYYGMRSILAGYITGAVLQGGLGQTADKSTEIIHIFVSANYFMPLFGAWLSDKFIGRYHTILWVSLFYCAGHGVLACSDFASGVDGKLWCLFAGLALIAFGSGGIKPCVSAFMGDQFKPDQSHLLQKAYGAFYWSINLGSFFSFLVVPWVKNHHGYSWAFGVPGILMAIATVIFWMGTKHYVRVPPSRETRTAGFFKVFWHALVNKPVGDDVRSLKPSPPSDEKSETRHLVSYKKDFWSAARSRFSEREVNAAKSVLPIIGVFLLVPPFWSLFDQTNSTWVLQGEKMKSCFFRHASDTNANQFAVSEIKDVNGLTKVLIYGTNAASTQVTATNAIFHTNHAAIFVWHQFSPESRQLLLDTNQTAIARAAAVAEEFNKLILGPSWYETNRFAMLKFDTDARFMVANASDTANNPRLNRLLLETTFSTEVSRLYRIGPEEMQSANPLLVMILVPLLTLLIYPHLGKWASPLRRMSYGMFLGAISYVIVAWLQQRLEAGAQMSVAWQTVPYIVLTAAEVLVSTTGLEFAFREAAPEMKSLIMSFWLLTVTVGNLLVAFITKFLTHGSGAESVTPGRFMLYAGLSFVVAIVFSVVTTFYRYRDESAARGK